MSRTTVTAVAAAVVLASAFVSIASAAPAPPFPDSWTTGNGYSLEALKGKVIVLAFYEEGCPSCRKAWPGRIAAAEKYADKPVLFVAVNSGNHPEKVASYMRSVKCDWPTLVDVDRSYEKAAGVGTISLRNIYQPRVITPAGELTYAGDIAESVERYIGQARWKIEPAEVPERYKDAWKAYEFGQLREAIGRLKRLSPREDADKAFAEKINGMLNADADARMTEAAAAENAGDTWTAYKTYEGVDDDFPGFEQEAAARVKVRELAADEKVKTEKAAMKMLAKVKMLAASHYPAQKADAKKGAALLIKKYPDTEAAEAAKAFQ